MPRPPQPELPPDPALDSRLNELRGRFQAALPGRISAIRQRMEALGPGDWSPSQAEELRTEVHSLAGSSGLFGFDQVGAAAGDLERLIIAATKSGTVTHAQTEELLHAFVRLEQAQLSAQ